MAEQPQMHEGSTVKIMGRNSGQDFYRERLANIPHGTTLLAQGVATTSNGAPALPLADITPFIINQPGNLIDFPETNLSIATPSRTPPADIPHVTIYRRTMGMAERVR